MTSRVRRPIADGPDERTQDNRGVPNMRQA